MNPYSNTYTHTHTHTHTHTTHTHTHTHTHRTTVRTGVGWGGGRVIRHVFPVSSSIWMYNNDVGPNSWQSNNRAIFKKTAWYFIKHSTPSPDRHLIIHSDILMRPSISSQPTHLKTPQTHPLYPSIVLICIGFIFLFYFFITLIFIYNFFILVQTVTYINNPPTHPYIMIIKKKIYSNYTSLNIYYKLRTIKYEHHKILTPSCQ
jgi:hypothetical protein